MDLSRICIRKSLKPRPGKEPHWQRLSPGCYLGYRPSAREGIGTWIARVYDQAKRNYCVKSIGDFASLAQSDRFLAAKYEAEDFRDLVQAGGVRQTKIETIAQACEHYALSNSEAKGRFARHIYDDPIANVKLSKLRRYHLQDWRLRLEAKPVVTGGRGTDNLGTRPRALSSINRDMAMLRAALNKVLSPGAPGTEAAWQEPLCTIRNANRQRTLYLDRTQRKALLDALPDDAAAFARALCLLPLRPGAAAQLTVGDFDLRTSELTIGKDKSGRSRRIVLPAETAAFFAAEAKIKPCDARLFTRDDGRPWDKDTWNDPITKASLFANLPLGVTAYTLRHSTITDLIIGGLPLLVVAQLSDTSIEIIERHYNHLSGTAATKALAGLVL